MYRGIYVRPEKSHFLPGHGILPSSDKIVETISKKTGEIISVHGAVALNRIGLSTQVPVRAIYHTTGRSRDIKDNSTCRGYVMLFAALFLCKTRSNNKKYCLVEG